MSLPKVGIIFLSFPTSNGREDISRCLSSLEKLDYPRELVELICVESKGSREPIKPWFDQTWLAKSGTTLPRISYLFLEKEIGFSGNNNLGLEKARELGCELVYLLNEDTDVDSLFLRTAVERMQSDEKIAIVQSLMLLGQERERINSSGNAYHFLGFGYSNDYKALRSALSTLRPSEIGYASGAAALVRVSVLNGGQLFDEKFFSYHEDTDISLLLRSKGWKIVVEPASIIWHHYQFGKAKINYYWMERNRWVLMLSFYRIWTLILIAPMALVMDLALSLFAIKNGWFDMKRKQIKELFDPKFWKWIRARRRAIQKSRTVGDRELLRLAVADIRFQEESVRNPVLEYIGNPIMKVYWVIVKLLIV
ncbi:glycosyltransferase family 2 protein [Candidatus Uhrbacteria bacterium]|nr:glycosyltransferase family 2 protein [Candidatus Uhrbacteria bacterium]